MKESGYVNIKELSIGVFMGGVSSEREISLKSGNAVLSALKELGLKAVGVDVSHTEPQYIEGLVKSYSIDLVFIALHGEFGEDGQLQRILERLNVRYTGSDSKASQLAMDKITAKKRFQAAGLNVPEHIIIEGFAPNLLASIEERIALPVMIKPSMCGSSIGLSLVEKKDELAKAFTEAQKFSNTIIVEQFIRGRELTVGILDDNPLPPIEIITDEPFFNYQAKYKSSSTQYIVPAQLDTRISEKLKTAGLLAHQSLSCRSFSRVDMLLDQKEDVYVLEVNTIPGLTQRSLLPKAANCIGIDFKQLCLKIIESAWD
jgi:D-alanine-D-alanine ligase